MSTIVMWAPDLRAQTEFYALLFDLPEPEIQGDFVSVTSSQKSVLLHRLPNECAAEVPLRKQLAANLDAAIKPVFTVDSIESALTRIANTFASVSSTEGRFGEFRYLDLVDPEGNVIQIQQRS